MLKESSKGCCRPVGKPFSVQYTGFAMPVKEKALQDAVKDALDGLISDGTYTTIIKTWGLEAGAITASKINGAS